MPTLNSLLGRGYFAKELPTPFNTRAFARAVTRAASLPASFVGPRPGWTSLVTHTLARPGLIPRPLGIPNPSAFYRLAREIQANWATIDAAIKRSPLSLTTPKDDPSGLRALVPAASFERTAERAELRSAHSQILQADVAQFYPSIYTHTLPWALHTKQVAKRRKRDLTLLGNRLDRWVQIGQDGQTAGIPVGPDTSLVLAELVLADCDTHLPGGTEGFRYFDDYELYFGTRLEAERAQERLQAALSGYNLSLNSTKTGIVSLPQPLQDEWVTQLRRTEIRNQPSEEQADLTALFDDAFRLAARFPDRHVVSYALGLLETRVINGLDLVHGDNWRYLQRLLLQSIHSQPGAVQKAAGLLNWGVSNGLPLDRAVVTKSLNRYILQNALFHRASEVAWGLWAALALRIPVHVDGARRVSEMDDDVVALLALHARSRRLFPTTFDLSRWSSWLTADQLVGEHWLLAYEAAMHGWLKPPAGDHIGAVATFRFLRSENVRFYNSRAGIVRKPRRAPSPFRWRGMAEYE